MKHIKKFEHMNIEDEDVIFYGNYLESAIGLEPRIDFDTIKEYIDLIENTEKYNL